MVNLSPLKIIFSLLACSLVLFGTAARAQGVDDPSAASPSDGPSAASPSPPAADKKVRIAMIGIISAPPSSESATSQITNSLTTDVVEHTACDVIDRQELGLIVQEIKLQNSGLIDPAEVTKIGQIKGVDYIVYGLLDAYRVNQVGTPPAAGETNFKINWFGKNGTKVSVNLTMRVVQVSTTKTVMSTEYMADQLDEDFDEQNALRGVVATIGDKFSQDILNIFPARQGKIIQVKIDPLQPFVRIDLGKQDGVRIGDIFRIIQITHDKGLQGQDIVDSSPVCSARVFAVDPDNAKLELGSLTAPQNSFVPDTTLFSHQGSVLSSGSCVVEQVLIPSKKR